MNNLSNARSCFNPFPTPVLWILIPVLFLGFFVSIFIFVVVHNAVFLLLLLLLTVLIVAFIVWNAYNWNNRGVLLLFLSSFPDSDLRTARDGHYVKITGVATCGSSSLESSYEKVPRCVYASTLLYKYRSFGSKLGNMNNRCFQWSLAYSERLATDFYITDKKSGMSAMVKAGCDSQVTPLVDQCVLVNTTGKNRVLSSYLRKWLTERNLSTEASLLRLEEGYIKEGSSVTVMGVLKRNNDAVSIVQPMEPISTGCRWSRLLLPADIEGLILRSSGSIDPGIREENDDSFTFGSLPDVNPLLKKEKP